MTCPRCQRQHTPGQPCLRGVVLVCGGRDFSDRGKAFRTLDKVAARVVIASVRHGACGAKKGKPFAPQDLKGADRWAHEWAVARGHQPDPMSADWDRFGAAAGPFRNQAMIDAGNVACVVAFPGGKGTSDMVRRARVAGLQIWEVTR